MLRKTLCTVLALALVAPLAALATTVPGADAPAVEAPELLPQEGVEMDIVFCQDVITPAYNPETGECRFFPTPCDVPDGWIAWDPRCFGGPIS